SLSEVRGDAGVEADRGDDRYAFVDGLCCGRCDLGALIWAEPEDLARSARRNDRANLIVLEPAGIGFDRFEVNRSIGRIGRNWKSDRPAQAVLQRLRRHGSVGSGHRLKLPRKAGYTLVPGYGGCAPLG